MIIVGPKVSTAAAATGVGGGGQSVFERILTSDTDVIGAGNRRTGATTTGRDAHAALA